MAFAYYYRITITHKDIRLGWPTADDIIYLKSSSPIELLPDTSREITDSIFTDRNPPLIKRITARQYHVGEKYMKELFGRLSQKPSQLENAAR